MVTRRFAGIDWAKDRHAVCVVDEGGRAVARFEVEHSDAGLRELLRRLTGVEGVAIERPDGPWSRRCSRPTCPWSSSPAAA